MNGNDHAQWLLLSSIVVSFGIVALLLLLNTAMLAGHSSLESAMDFPKNQLRDLRSTSLEEAVIIGNETSNLYNSDQDRRDHFQLKYEKYVNDMKGLYERHGAIVNISCSLYNDTGVSTFGVVQLAYYDGNTVYLENKLTEKLW
jgi:hypothetical protein